MPTVDVSLKTLNQHKTVKYCKQIARPQVQTVFEGDCR